MDTFSLSPAKGTRYSAHLRAGSADEKSNEKEVGGKSLGRNTKSSSTNVMTPMSPI